MRVRLGGLLPIIGVGGIHSAQSAIAKFEAGADAIQIYTALVYGGLGLLEEIKSGLVAEVRRRGVGTIAGLRDARLKDWAEGKATLAP